MEWVIIIFVLLFLFSKFLDKILESPFSKTRASKGYSTRKSVRMNINGKIEEFDITNGIDKSLVLLVMKETGLSKEAARGMLNGKDVSKIVKKIQKDTYANEVDKRLVSDLDERVFHKYLVNDDIESKKKSKIGSYISRLKGMARRKRDEGEW